MNERGLRIRAILGSNWQLLVVIFVLFAAAGGWAAYGAYVDPPRETTQEVVASWGVEGEWDHGATVTEDNSVFPVGTELDDRSVYFGSIAPVLSGSFEVGYDTTAASASDVSIDAESALVARSIGEDDGENEGGDGTVYWSETEELNSTTDTDVGPDETVTTSFEVNTSAVDERVGQIREEIGGDPGTLELFVETTVTVEGTFDGDEQTVSLSYTLPLELDGTIYRVDDPGPVTEEFERTEPRTTTADPGLLDGVFAPFLLVVGIVGAAGVATAGYTGRFAVSEAEREWLAFRDDRAEFDEWVTRISLPESALGGPTARAASLQDLVDFAIDNSAGVVEDPDANAFYVVTDECVYVYEPPETPARIDDAGGAGEVGGGGANGTATEDPLSAGEFESETPVAPSSDLEAHSEDTPAADGALGDETTTDESTE